jgi:hypothetical protein
MQLRLAMLPERLAVSARALSNGLREAVIRDVRDFPKKRMLGPVRSRTGLTGSIKAPSALKNFTADFRG